MTDHRIGAGVDQRVRGTDLPRLGGLGVLDAPVDLDEHEIVVDAGRRDERGERRGERARLGERDGGTSAGRGSPVELRRHGEDADAPPGMHDRLDGEGRPVGARGPDTGDAELRENDRRLHEPGAGVVELVVVRQGDRRDVMTGKDRDALGDRDEALVPGARVGLAVFRQRARDGGLEVRERQIAGERRIDLDERIVDLDELRIVVIGVVAADIDVASERELDRRGAHRIRRGGGRDETRRDGSGRVETGRDDDTRWFGGGDTGSRARDPRLAAPTARPCPEDRHHRELPPHPPQRTSTAARATDGPPIARPFVTPAAPAEARIQGRPVAAGVAPGFCCPWRREGPTIIL